MKRLFQSNVVTVFVLFAAAALIDVMVYPEVFVNFKTSFPLWQDYSSEYPMAFALTNMFYQGGLQLWNFFGQMPFFHTYAVIGLLKLPNVVTAVVYYLLAPFSDDSGRLFHHVFAWTNLMTILFVRLAGIFLMLKLVTRNRYILNIGTVLFAVFFSQLSFVLGSFWMNCFPLGIYLVVRFFMELQWRQLAVMLIFFAVALGGGVLLGGYMYLPLHFVIVAAVLWRIFCYHGPRKSDIRPGDFSQWRKTAGVVFVMVLILAPYAYISKFGFPDLAFDQANSRLAHVFSPAWYFHDLSLGLGSPWTFFSNTLNMQTLNIFTLYEGWSFLFLALAGLVLSRNTLKYIFALAILFLWLLSFPREGLNIGLIAHWINALTNPLKTIPRGYVTTCQGMLPYLLMPLAVMGIEVMIELYKGKKYSGFTLGVLGAMTLVITLTNTSDFPGEVKVYLVACNVLVMTAMAWLHFRGSSRARHFLLGSLCLIAVIDIFFIVYQTKMQFAQFDRKPTVLDAAPQAGMVGYDFANPSIFPFRYSYTVNFSYGDETYLWFPHGVSSVMHHVINQGLNFTYLNGYSPRHVAFAQWLNNPGMLAYLTHNNEFIFLARAAINASPGALSRIASAGLARQVVEVDDPGQSLKLPDQWPGGLTSKDGEDLQYSQILGTFDRTITPFDYHLQGDMIFFVFHLPATFPEHLATSIFPAEQPYLRFFIEKQEGQWQEFQQAEGELIRPYTFDVQNIKKGVLTAAFPMNDFLRHRKFVLLYPSSENQGVEGLWRRQFDNLGITFRAKRDGWLVVHNPYDNKWKISVDGHPATYWRVNESFIGFPLTQGEHKILIQYWPGSPLRILLLISAVVMTLALPVLIFLALKWEQSG